jgi:hypothetical protein
MTGELLGDCRAIVGRLSGDCRSMSEYVGVCRSMSAIIEELKNLGLTMS